MSPTLVFEITCFCPEGQSLCFCRSDLCKRVCIPHHIRYITVSERKQRRLFYILTEAEEDPENAPVILWLNGWVHASHWGGCCNCEAAAVQQNGTKGGRLPTSRTAHAHGHSLGWKGVN